MAEWITPKTDWKKEDSFNFDDFNRVNEITKYLYELYEIDLPVDEETREMKLFDIPYSPDFANVSYLLQYLNRATFYFHTADISIIVGGGNLAPNADKWNKIGEFQKYLYELKVGELRNLPSLEFRLGNIKPFTKMSKEI